MSKINKLFNIYLGDQTLIRIADFRDYEYEHIMETQWLFLGVMSVFWYSSVIKSHKHSVMKCWVSLECQCKSWVLSEKKFLQIYSIWNVALFIFIKGLTMSKGYLISYMKVSVVKPPT